MRTHDNPAVAAGLSVDPARWREQFDELMGRIAGRFAPVEPRRRARAFVLGLLSGLRRKNCWTIAEQAGDATPDGMQHLLAAARWDASAVRDDVRAYVVEYLGSADAVLVVDETGDLKKGTRQCRRAAPVQVRRWGSWYRWTTLAMLALAFLTVTAAAEHARHPPPGDQIPLTRNEIAALFGTLIIEPARNARHRLRWSAWRRRHQHRAKTCHYQQQARQPPRPRPSRTARR